MRPHMARVCPGRTNCSFHPGSTARLPWEHQLREPTPPTLLGVITLLESAAAKDQRDARTATPRGKGYDRIEGCGCSFHDLGSKERIPFAVAVARSGRRGAEGGAPFHPGAPFRGDVVAAVPPPLLHPPHPFVSPTARPLLPPPSAFPPARLALPRAPWPTADIVAAAGAAVAALAGWQRPPGSGTVARAMWPLVPAFPWGPTQRRLSSSGR